MIWFHGTPDGRQIRTAGRFEERFETRRVVKDPEGLSAARLEAENPTLSARESADRMSKLDAFYDFVRIPVPVFLSASRATASTYADDRRALDFQNAEPAVFRVLSECEPAVMIDAGGETFRGLRWGQVEAGLRRAGLPADDVKRTLTQALGRDADARIRVADLGAALWLHGVNLVDVRNVVDTHTGKGQPDVVRMVFDAGSLRLPDLETEDSPNP